MILVKSKLKKERELSGSTSLYIYFVLGSSISYCYSNKCQKINCDRNSNSKMYRGQFCFVFNVWRIQNATTKRAILFKPPINATNLIHISTLQFTAHRHVELFFCLLACLYWRVALSTKYVFLFRLFFVRSLCLSRFFSAIHLNSLLFCYFKWKEK